MRPRYSASLSRGNDVAQRAYLLDTNVLLAALIAPERLTSEVRQWLANPENVIYFSAASIWEIAIKRSLNREGFDFSPEDIHGLALATGFTELPIHSTHCYPIAHMVWHHRDPFDRILIAQAQSLPAYLLTTDGMLSQYSNLVMRITQTS